MARYIDADQMISGIRNALDKNKDTICNLTYETFEMFIAMLEKEPTADVEEVVRCKDCKHHGKFSCAMSDLKYPKNTDDKGFCHRGERAKGGDNN